MTGNRASAIFFDQGIDAIWSDHRAEGGSLTVPLLIQCETPKFLRALGSETEKTVRDDQKSVDSDDPLRHNPAFFLGGDLDDRASVRSPNTASLL